MFAIDKASKIKSHPVIEAIVCGVNFNKILTRYVNDQLEQLSPEQETAAIAASNQRLTEDKFLEFAQKYADIQAQLAQYNFGLRNFIP